MKITLSYKYSTLDKCHEFGLEFSDCEHDETYVRWVWFHLGELMAEMKVNKRPYDTLLFPFKCEKTLKTYAYCNDASRQAKYIYNRINKKLNK